MPSLSDPARWIENFDGPHDWAYHYAPSAAVADRAIQLARGKVAGGSGRINALVWSRGPRSDFDGWAAGGMTGWDYDSLLPYFRASEDWEDGATALRGGGGPIQQAISCGACQGPTVSKAHSGSDHGEGR